MRILHISLFSRGKAMHMENVREKEVQSSKCEAH